MDKLALLAFYAQVRAVYPQPLRLFLVQDNWPTHSLPEVLAAAAHHGLHFLFLPTYASWLNPLEKLWHWLRQQVLHVHPFADDLAHLRQLVCEFLDQFLLGSEVLLRYVGFPV